MGDTPPELPDILKGKRAEFQLDPISVPYHIQIIHGPPDTDVGDLSIWYGLDDNGWPTTYSAWAFTDEQRAQVAAGAHIRLGVWQVPIPPLAVAVEAPFCERHARAEFPEGVEKAWNGETYYCPICDDHGGRDDARHPERGVPDDLRRDFRPSEDE